MLRGKIVVSTEEIIKAVEECESATQNKQKTTGRPRGRPRKDVQVEQIVALEKAADDRETSESGGDD